MPCKNDQLSFILLRIWYREEIAELKYQDKAANSWLKWNKNLPKESRKAIENAHFWVLQDLTNLQVGLAMMQDMKDHYN